MIGKLKKYYKTEGLKGIFAHFGNYVRFLLTPLIMTTIERIRKPEYKIVFCNFAGKGYGGYPKAICDELIKRNTGAQLVWLVNGCYEFPREVTAVKISSYKALYELATARIWIDNCRKNRMIRKGSNQFYLQTWHGGGPCLKKIEGDAVDYLSANYIQDAKNDTKMADLFISDCEWQNNNYRTAFWYKGEIMNCTTPPNDFFYQNWKDVKDNVYRTLGLESNKKIVLYAPTFRNNHNLDCYDIDYQRVLNQLNYTFGGEWVFVIRLHPTMAEEQSRIQFTEQVINGTSCPHIEELLIASEVLITDFSASMFLAFRWKIPAFLYASDLHTYLKNERPLYFEINKLPASFTSSNDDLVQSIQSFSKDEYLNKCEEFAKEVGFFEGGRSVEIITDRIEKELQYSNR